ncbi:MAG: glycosyltransferase family 2 protein [Eubacteriales bacterium]
MPEISVIVPVYNVERYLRQCIDSILAQTFRDFELILVDDGSIDQSGKICDEYAQKDNRVIVIHKKNGGLSDARNAGLDIAIGEYIGFVDSDDYIDTRMYEKMYREIKNTSADIVCCAMDYFYDGNSRMTGKWPDISEAILYERKDFIDNFYPVTKEIIRASACNKLYCKYVFDTVRFPVGKKYEDSFARLDILNAANQVLVLPDALYFYRQRNGSIMSTVSESDMDEVEFVYHYYLFFIEKRLKEQSKFALLHLLQVCFKMDFLMRFVIKKSACQSYINVRKLYKKMWFKMFLNSMCCRMLKFVMLVKIIAPKKALAICQTYFPECLPESLKKKPERVN